MPTPFVLAWRTLSKTRGLSTVALVCLASAIGIATAAFTVVHAALLSTLPVPNGDRMVMVHEWHRTGSYNIPHTASQLTELQSHTTSFDGLGAWFSRNVTLGASPDNHVAGLVRAAYVSADSLAIVGIPPAIGRLPRFEDVGPGAARVVLLGHDIWRVNLGGEPSVVGRTIEVAGQPHTVIGVMPAGFRFPIREDLWIPVAMDITSVNATDEAVTVFGRLKHGVSSSTAAAELNVLNGRDRASTLEDATVSVVMPFTRGFMTPGQEWAIYAFILGLLSFMTLVAGNLANLFFARNSARRRDLAIQSALGASRSRLILPQLLESLLLSVGAAMAGLALARSLVRWFESVVEDVPWWADFELNAAVAGFVAAATLLVSVVAGLGPALRLTRPSIARPLQPGESHLRFSRIGSALIVGQVATSVAFLSVVGVLAQALLGFSFDRYAIAQHDVLVAQVYLGPPPESELANGADRRQVFQRHYARSLEQFRRISARVGEEPGVSHVTFATHFPGNDVESVQIRLESSARAGTGDIVTRIASVGPGFFETLGASVVHGRDFGSADHRGEAQAVIVNEPFADKYFPGQSPLGQRLRLVRESSAPPEPWLEIVGIVPDLALNPGDSGRADGIYVPFGPSNFARLAIRTGANPHAVVPRLHDIVMSEQARAQLQSVQTLSAQMSTAGAVFRGLGAGLLVIGGTALLLSTVSIYSLVSFGVARRTREIGIRLALGATRQRILRHVLRRELSVVAAGAVVGVALGAALYQVVSLLPFDLSPAAPSLVAAFIGLIVIVGGGACLMPARRALWIQPAEALRHE